MKRLFNVFGIKPNGSPTTFQGQYRDIVKLIVVAMSLAFTAGAATLGFKELPVRVSTMEKEMASVRFEVAQNKTDHQDIKNDLRDIKKILMEQRRNAR